MEKELRTVEQENRALKREIEVLRARVARLRRLDQNPTRALSTPGPCVEVLPPSLGSGARRAAIIPEDEQLRELLTSELRRHLPEAMLLGAGPDSDGRFRVSVDAVRAACIADRSLALHLACTEGLCRVETSGRRFEGRRMKQLDLPVSAPRRDFLAAVRQLVADQAPFLR